MSGVFTGADFAGDTVLDCDVVVVGSGAGGAVAAAELAEGGLDVIVLEEGRHYRTSDFNARAAAMIRAMYRNGGATLALGAPPVMYQEGRAVGGSTVINGGMSWRTPEKILHRWVLEHGLHGLSARQMEPFFERVERRIHVRYQDPESVGRDNQLLHDGAVAMGWKVIANRRNQVHCAGSNNCAFGCPTGAKQSALVSYIPRALQFGARVYSNVRVDEVLFHGKRATGVVGRVVAGANGQARGQSGRQGGRGARVTVRAKLVVSACGAIHTPALLRRSGVRVSSGRLGKNLSLHPNCKVVAIFDEDVRGWQGVHQAFQVREFQEEGFLFAAVNVPPSILAMTAPQYGAALGDFLADYNRMVVAGLLVEDTSTGKVRMTPWGQPVATYQLSDFDADKLKRGTALLCQLLFAAGARRVVLPFAGVGDLRSPDEIRRIFTSAVPKSSMEVLTVHMMGTAAMGSDRARSVVDEFGRVHGADRLLVSDASLFPGPIGVNPMLSIQALATRNAAHVLDNLRRYTS